MTITGTEAMRICGRTHTRRLDNITTELRHQRFLAVLATHTMYIPQVCNYHTNITTESTKIPIMGVPVIIIMII